MQCFVVMGCVFDGKGMAAEESSMRHLIPQGKRIGGEEERTIGVKAESKPIKTLQKLHLEPLQI